MDIHFQNFADLKIGNGVYIGNYFVVHVINYNNGIRNSFLEIGQNTYIGELSNIRASGVKLKLERTA